MGTFNLIIVLTTLLGVNIKAERESRYPLPSEPAMNTKLYDLDKGAIKTMKSSCFPFILGRKTNIINSHILTNEKYLPNQNCVKLVKAEPGHRVRITFTKDYFIEEEENCKYDSVTIQDGPFVFSPIIDKICGHGSANSLVFTSSASFMRLVFSTDDVIEESGFTIYINNSFPAPNYTEPGEVECCKSCYYNISFEGQGQAEISLDAIENFYKAKTGLKNIDCVWDISTKDGKNMWMWVEDDLAHSPVNSCSDRTIEIFSADDKWMSQDFRQLMTGGSPCYLVRRKFFPVVGSPRILVHVKSIDNFMMPTIRLNFTSFTEPNPEPENLCNSTQMYYTCEDGRLCLDMDLVCNGYSNCPDGDDESKAACEMKNSCVLPTLIPNQDDGPSFRVQFIFIAAAVLFFVLVSVALFISAKRMIRENRENEERKTSSTVIMNQRPSRLFHHSTIRRLIEPVTMQDGYSHDSVSQNSRMGHYCPYSTRTSIYSKRGSWFTNGSISNLSISSDARLKCDTDHPSPRASPVAFLSPDIYANHMELKKLRSASA